MAPTLVELSGKLDEMQTRADEKDKEYKAEVEKKENEHKEAMDDKEKEHKDAMEEKEKEAKRAEDDEKKNHDAVLKAVLKAMDEDDPEKRKEAIKSAMDEKHKEHESSTKTAEHENDEEKKAMKAQLEYQDKIMKKPKLQILEAAYAGVGTDKSKLAEYVADWNKLTLPQLDAAIEQAKPIIELSGQTIESQPTPLGLSKGLSEFTGSTKTGNEEYSAKIDKMSTEELFAR